MISSPRLQAVRTIVCTELVVPPTIKNACAAPKASAASSSASRITDTGWQRLSSGFILPRNVHRSVLNALVLCGAIPVYVNPEVDQRLGISLGMKREQVEKAIKEHPKGRVITRKPIVPSEEELEENTRSKSSKLRVFEREIQ